MAITSPGDVEDDLELSPADLAKRDQDEALARDSKAIAETDQLEAAVRDSPKAGNVKGTINKSKKSLQKKLLIGGGAGVSLISIGVIFFLLILFKNIHIKNLFLDYEYGKFNRAFRDRLEQSVEEADPNGTSTADTTVQPGDTPEVALSEVNSAEIKQLQEQIQNDPQAFDNSAADVMSLDQTASITGTSASQIDSELGIDTGIASEAGKGDSQAAQDTDTAIQDEISQGESSAVAPTQATQDAADDTSAAIKKGASLEGATNAAAEGFSRGLNSFFSRATGPFIFATIGCIARDIYVSGYKAVAQLKLTGLANSAATTNKYADCQVQSKCSLSQIGAVAGQFDNTVGGKSESFTSACGTVRASNQVAQPGVNCTDLDTNMRPSPQLADGFTGQLGALLHVADTVNTVVKDIPGLGAGCTLILKPVTQAIFAIGNVGSSILAAVFSDGASLSVTSVAQAASLGVGQVLATNAGKALALDAALHYGGLLFKQNFTPIQKGNMQAAGDKTLATDACVRNGCRQLTPTENTQLALEIHSDTIQQQQSRGLAYRLFSPSNPMSTLGMLADRIPTTPQTAVASISQFFATVLNPEHLSKSLLGAINPAMPAWAADTASSTYGIPDYGFTDAELSKWKVIDNSKWVQTNVSAQERAKFDKCFDATQTKLGEFLTGDGNGSMCNDLANGSALAFADTNSRLAATSSAPVPVLTGEQIDFAHYRIYKLDIRVTHDLALMYNNQGGIGGVNNAAPTSTAGCVNPFSDPSWILSRTDQGVDYNPPNGKSMPVFAICDGTITSTYGPGWPGGNIYINFKLSSGPFAGKCIYVAEHLSNIAPKDTPIKAGQQIATALPGSPWTEWGWSAGPAQVATPYPKGTPESKHVATEGGKAFARFIKSLGGPVRDDPGPGPLYAGASCS